MKKLLLTAGILFCLAPLFAQPTAGLVAYFKMDGNFNDSGPFNITGTNAGATATTNAAGTANTAMQFLNPTSTVVQYATHALNANLNFTASQDFTITFSFFINTPYLHNGGIYENNMNYNGYGVWYWNAGGVPAVQFNFRNNSVGTVVAGGLPTGVWINIACVKTGGSLQVYVNGVLNNSTTVGTQTPSYTFPGRFGTMFYNSIAPPNYNGHNGKIDELRIYNRALSNAEILWIATLPIELVSFTAAKSNDDILLHWKTSMEQNCKHFNIQRSTGGSNFTNIGRVKAVGNTTLATTYQFRDDNVKSVNGATHVFYRLESVDMDERKQYSSIISMPLNTIKLALAILQNPAVDELRLQFYAATKCTAQVIITDAAGRQLSAKQMLVNKGNVFTALPIKVLPTGVYSVTVVQNGEKQSMLFMKQ